MKSLLLLCLFAVQAQAVIVPLPLMSPKFSAIPKDKPMARVKDIPISGPSLQMTMAVTKDINFFGCDTNNPACQLYDSEYVRALQPAGLAMRIEFCDSLPQSGAWALVAAFEAGPVDRYAEFTRYYPSAQRPSQRYYRAVPVAGISRRKAAFTMRSFIPFSNVATTPRK